MYLLKSICFVLLSLFITMPVYADELVSAKLGYQLLSPEGSIAGTVNDVGGVVDIEKDLNLDDSDGYTAEVALNWEKVRLSLNYVPLGFSGNGNVSESVVINGETFSVGQDVASDLSINLYDLGLTYYLVNIDDLPVRVQLGLELAVKIADAEFTLSSASARESVSATIPIPTVGVNVRLALADFLGVSGRVGYMEFQDNYFMDAEAQVEFSPVPLIGIYAGIRYLDLEIDEDDIFIETQMSGPFGGLMVRF
jgi:hypothetical protein